MTKNSYQKPSQQTQEEALKIARGAQRPAQTKEQTRLIAQGIQKGIDLYSERLFFRFYFLRKYSKNTQKSVHY